MTQPRILLVSLELQPWFDEMYKTHLDRIMEKARMQRAKTAASALRQLTEQPLPDAILVTDAALVESENAQVYEALLEYVRQGGIAVFMGQFPAFVIPGDMKDFFGLAGLSWEAGSYTRTTCVRNSGAVGVELAAKLPAGYSQKALFVKNVKPEEAWYCTTEDSRVESRVFPPESADRPGEAPVAVGRVGNGRLAYIGDVNAEEESGDVTLALCGLL